VRDLPGLRRALLTWYRRERRDLPWRATRDPYRVWLSEVMLQQTQVATATPYYERFVARFPNLRALARAPLDRVLTAWSGLGYYRRARHLHAAARLVVREHAGRVPSEPRAFAALPGVGRYTAGAVLSIGFGVPLPVLDGNVARVFSRLTGLPLSIKRPADAKRLWAMAEAWMPPPGPRAGAAGEMRSGRKRVRGGGSVRERVPDQDPGSWNQALMELGATVCTPRAPRCHACPVRAHCRALATGRQDRLPPAPARRATERVRRAIAWVERRGRVLVVKREGPLLDGMWEPPGVELAGRERAAAALAERLAGLGVRGSLRPTHERVRHTITHRDITVEVWRCAPDEAPLRSSASLRWVAPGDMSLALTALARKVLAR
jgi:A/G-specific adenine glycosylase